MSLSSINWKKPIHWIVLSSTTNQNYLKMSLWGKNTLKSEILAFLPRPKRGKPCSEVLLLGILELILYRLKTGCQWRELPIKRYISGNYNYRTIFYHFNRWSKLEVWQTIWLDLLRQHRKQLNLHMIQLDGTHTRTHGFLERVGYLKRKGGRTSNLLCLCDEQGKVSYWLLVQYSQAITTTYSILEDNLKAC